MKTLAFTLTVSLLLLTQCKWFDNDDDNPIDKLPPATQTGAYTFACLIDGQPWIVKGLNSGTTAMYQFEALSVGGSMKEDGVLRLIKFAFLTKVNIETNQIYHLPRTDTTVIAEYIKSPACIYSNEYVTGGRIRLTRFDTNTRIVSGTFELTVFNPDCGDTVRITDGRFDIPNLVL